jgi:hypothetical protein
MLILQLNNNLVAKAADAALANKNASQQSVAQIK